MILPNKAPLAVNGRLRGQVYLNPATHMYTTFGLKHEGIVWLESYF